MPLSAPAGSDADERATGVAYRAPQDRSARDAHDESARLADLRHRIISRVMVADALALDMIAGLLGLLPRPEGHDAGKPMKRSEG
ncbi:hypothetical protein [Pseudooceanicola algae]|uniref:Uncharacterized protein n=1 Tax=Pseudooceanicola algae TaxID=1537215 RepID=A0A418SD93_9RHOB|nr:hypothetical protein [Pseudooceanicola algae]QPM89355.1 hypothetical protein PSAL_005710 [Pseudooceanicola algae]